jgi:hypothetical protein
LTKNRTAYFKALGLAAPPAKKQATSKTGFDESEAGTDHERSAREAALKRSHEIRQFEIELYWKRATYFWVLQAAVFTALGLIWKDDAKQIPEIVPVALAALGLLTAAAGWFSAQGSKFWQENWERHIDMLEDEFEGKLHKTAWVGEMGVRWSVSNINDRLILFFVAFWLLVFGVVSFTAVPDWSFCFTLSKSEMDFTQMGVIILTLLSGTGLYWLYEQKSKLRGSKANWEIEATPKEVQLERPRLFRKKNEMPFIVKRGQIE